MKLRKLEDIQNGDVTEFLQIYLNGEPEIFCERFKGENVIKESYSFLSRILDEFGIAYKNISEENEFPEMSGENYSYEGIGRVAKDNGIIKIWKFPGYSYNKRHLLKYQNKFPNLKFEKNI